MGSGMRTVRLRITGRVQGVGYRDWMQRTAAGLCLAGWVRNRRDGTVEAVLSGSSVSVDHMIEQCRQGPPMAQTSRIEVLDESSEPPPGFAVLPTT